MSASKKTSALPNNPQVVGAIPTAAALALALRLPAGAVDFFELRVDHFADEPEELLRAAPKLRAPLIVTVRHPAEGGMGALGYAARADLYARFMPVAKYIDIELCSLPLMSATVAAARAAGVGLIASAHFFKSTPPLRKLETLCQQAAAARADIAKIAALTTTSADLGRLLTLFTKPKMPLSVMGMGHFGKASRLLLARAGSVLNYGYLDAPNASGQWEATLLKSRIAEL